MTRPTRARRRSVALPVLVALIAIACRPAFAQEESTKDQFALDPLDRESAELPLPYGLIVSAAYPVYQSQPDALNSEEPEKELLFEAHAYVDTWQIGFARRIYGDMFQLTARTVGRDVYSGWYVEYGTSDFTVRDIFDNQGRRDEVRTRTLYGVGLRSQTGYKPDVSLSFLSSLTFGYSTVEDDVDDENAMFYLTYGVGGGGRIPFGFGALQLYAIGELGIFPNNESGVDPNVLLALRLGATFGLNLQTD